MIVSFKDRRLETVLAGRLPKGFPPDCAIRTALLLRALHAVDDVNELRNPPGNRLEKLQGDRSGLMSLRVNRQWRICFRWTDAGAEDVEFVDYH